MNVHTFALTPDNLRDSENSRPLRTVAVQLDDPFMAGLKVSSSNQLVWDARSEEKSRVDHVKRIIDELFQIDGQPKPDIIVFPELSVPELAHSAGYFQCVSNMHKCIIAPGTYISYDSSLPEFRNNVAKIYVPGLGRPFTIHKANPTPDELKYVDPNTSAGNVLQLLWSPPNLDSTVAITFFICRDFLQPLAKGQIPTSADLWSYEGINIVMMHNKEPRLFEGQAAVYVRRLRGPGKLSLFVNNAGSLNQLGTALIAPVGNAQRERDDIAKSLPWDRAGVMAVTHDLWDVYYSEIRPDKITQCPIKDISANSFQIESETSEVIFETESEFPKLRAIWRPAFLEVIGRVISLEFHRINRESSIRALIEEKIPHAYSALVRGESDLMIRRYAYSTEGPIDGKAPPLESAFTGLTPEDTAGMFEEEHSLRLFVRPSNILKYRGKSTNIGFDNDKASIASILSSEKNRNARIRHDLLTSITLAATEIDPDIGLPDNLKPFFYDEFESNIPIGQQYGNCIRETYTLIHINITSDMNAIKMFDEQIICNFLQNKDEVREIFKISNDATDARGFYYVLKFKSAPFVTDAILSIIRKWSDGKRSAILTRTFDVVEVVKRGSILGISNFDIGNQMKEFRRIIHDIDKNISLTLLRSSNERSAEIERLFFLSGLRESGRIAASRCEGASLGQLVDDIYGLCFVSYVEKRPAKIESHFTKIKHQILDLYKIPEKCGGEILQEILGNPEDNLRNTLISKFPAVERHKNLEQILSDPLKILLTFAELLLPEIWDERTRNALKRAREAQAPAAALRNGAVHGGRDNDLREMLRISDDGWEARLIQVEAYVNNIIAVVEILQHIRRAKS